MSTFSFLDSNGAVAYYDPAGAGTVGDPFRARSPDLLGDLASTPASAPDVASANLNALIRGMWASIRSGINATYGNPTLAVTSSLSTGLFLDFSQFSRVRIQVNNTGANALSAFEISSKAHATGDPQIHLNTSAHYTAPTSGSILRHCGDLTGAPIDLTTLPAGGKAVLALDLTNFFVSEIRIRATSASGTNLQIYWGAN